MKKLFLLIATVAVTMATQAQVVVGLQGGYYQNSVSNTVNVNYTTHSQWLAGAELGYMVLPKLYVGVSGHFTSLTDDDLVDHKVIPYAGMAPNPMVDNYRLYTTQSGWSVSPTVKYELFKYGNMHFHVQLQGTVSQLGYKSTIESFNRPWLNGGEYEERDAVADSIKTFAWGVSVRPTLTYEFSTHLAAELVLDFLSIGYATSTVTNERAMVTLEDGTLDYPSSTESTLYAGINTLNESLRWEMPTVRLGFKYTF